MPVKSKVAVPPTLCFSMSSEASAVFVYVQVGVSPAVDDRAHGGVARIEAGAAGPEAKVPPLPVPMVITAPLAAQTMFVSVQPGSGVSWTSLVPNWAAGEGERRVGRRVGDRGVAGEGGRRGRRRCR